MDGGRPAVNTVAHAIVLLGTFYLVEMAFKAQADGGLGSPLLGWMLVVVMLFVIFRIIVTVRDDF